MSDGTATILSAAAGTAIRSADVSSYAKAQAGTGTVFSVYDAATTNSYPIGQRYVTPGDPAYTVYLSLLAFDLSSIPVGAIITNAVLSFFMSTDLSTTDFTIEARGPYDWGAAVETGDYVVPGNLANYPLLASMGTSGKSAAQYYALASAAALALEVVKGGTLKMLVSSDRVRAGTTPTGEERWHAVSEYVANQEPKLVVDWHVPDRFIDGFWG